MKIIKRRNSRMSEQHDYSRYFNSSWDIKNGLLEAKKTKWASFIEGMYMILTDQYRII